MRTDSSWLSNENWPFPSNKPAIGDGPKKMDQSETCQYYSIPTSAPCRMDGWMDGWMDELMDEWC